MDLLNSKPAARTILQEAQEAVFTARQKGYGHPAVNFQRTADLWNGYMGATDRQVELTPSDVAHMMILLKMARLVETPNHRDSIVDMAGYAETLARVQGVDA